MSRAFRIRIAASESIVRDITARDEICTELELIEILPAEQMSALLKNSLKARGFEEHDGVMERTQDGVTVSVDPVTATVTIHTETTETVKVQKSSSVWVEDNTKPGQELARQRLQQAIRQELEKAVDPKEGVLQQRVSAELEAALSDLSDELAQVSNEVTREALKIKASSMGEVKSLIEDPQAGSLTIKIEV